MYPSMYTFLLISTHLPYIPEYYQCSCAIGSISKLLLDLYSLFSMYNHILIKCTFPQTGHM